MSGKLYLCATPIGNLEDITLRVLRALKEADIIAAEDTRNTLKILNHFEIDTPMTSYHEHNKIEKGEKLIEMLLSGKNIALVTDAGTPAISDPGEDLARKCIDAGIEVTSLPGASACITALTLSGMPTERFAFEGFLPREKKELEKRLLEIKDEIRTIVIYEAPHRIRKTLASLYEALGDRRISICRELTKKFETVLRMTLSEAVSYYDREEPRGEFVIVLEGKSEEALEAERLARWEGVPVEEHVRYYESQGMPRMDAIKQTAKDLNLRKNEVYKMLQK